VHAAVVLSVSVLAFTLVHLEVFDLGRLQAWAWLALFSGFATVTTWLALRRGEATSRGPALPPWARAAFAIAAAGLGALALALWIDPTGFGLPPLGGRFAGSWVALLAVLAGWAAAGGRADEARLPALALIALPAGALLAALRTGGDPAYAAALAGLALLGAALLSAARRA
jgi:LPXTG-motif cell wall-anchored protein